MERAVKQPRKRINTEKRFGGVSNSKKTRIARASSSVADVRHRVGEITGLRRMSDGATTIQGFWKSAPGVTQSRVRKTNRLKCSKMAKIKRRKEA